MNILLIKTDQPVAELYLYKDSDLIAKIFWQADRHLAESISLKIDDLLRRSVLSYDNLDGIGVFSGPGSFTGLRIGISVANAMAYGLDVPIVGLGGDDWLIKLVDQLKKGNNDKIVVANYGAPARITKPRK